jgi:hypothetical protein
VNSDSKDIRRLIIAKNHGLRLLPSAIPQDSLFLFFSLLAPAFLTNIRREK